MRRLLHSLIPVPILIVVAIYCAFPHPTHDQAQLKAVAEEAQRLMRDHPMGPSDNAIFIPRDKWPAAIASLKPYRVVVFPASVDIGTRPFFDGGWGYGYARDKQDLGMLVECWSELGHDVYWHGPC